MNGFWKGILTAGLVAGGLYWMGGKFSQKLRAIGGNVKFKGLEFDGDLAVTITMNIQNGNHFGIQISSMTGGLFHGGIKIADIVTNQPQTIAASTTSEFSFDGVISSKGVIDQIKQLLDGGKYNYLWFRGGLKVGAITYPIELQMPLL
mgnify:FL=1